MALWTWSSPSLRRPSRHSCFDRSRRHLPAACALASALALSACGSAAPPARQQATAPVTQLTTAAPAPSPTTVATTPQTTTQPARTTTLPAPATPSPSTVPPPAPATTAAPATPPAVSAHAVQEHAELRLVSRISSSHYTQRGRVAGTFDGELTLEAKLVASGVSVRFTVQPDDGGSVFGEGTVTLTLNGAPQLPFSGTARITGGTGRFAHARGSGLKVTGRAAVDGSRGSVDLAGTITY